MFTLSLRVTRVILFVLHVPADGAILLRSESQTAILEDYDGPHTVAAVHFAFGSVLTDAASFEPEAVRLAGVVQQGSDNHAVIG